MAQSLTVAEKILFHLNSYTKAEEKYEVPFDITQDGIAQSCGISRAHAAIELKKLRASELILEKLSHVRRAKSRRKVYFLTQVGKAKAIKIVKHVESGAATPGVDASRISQETGPARRPRRHKTAIPQPRLFFGREEELSYLRSLIENDEIDIVMLIGLSGIGKTTLLSKFARDSKASIFWYTFTEWETELSLLKSLADFLEESGDNRLENYLKSDRIDLGEIRFLLEESLSENRRIFIFDDVDSSPRLFSIIRMIIENIGPNKLFLIGKSPPPFLEDLKGTGKVIKDVLIGGFDLSAARELLSNRNIKGEDAKRLHDLTNGHPLLLRLIPSCDESSAKIELANFVKNNFLKELSSNDIFIVEKCAVFRKPFSGDYLSRDERHVLQLPIFYRISGNSIMHEMIRNIVIDQIPAQELKEYHSMAADFFLHQSNWSERLYHLIGAGRFLEAEMLIHYHSDDLIAAEPLQNLLDELTMIPPRISRYTSSVKLLVARTTALIGDEQGAIEKLTKIIEEEEGDKRSEALIQLASRPVSDKDRKMLKRELKALLANDDAPEKYRAEAGLSLTLLSLSDNNLGECETYARSGLSFAGNAFCIDTVSSLNRLLGELLIMKQEYSEATEFLVHTAPSYEEIHRPLYHRLLGKALSKIGRIGEARRTLEIGTEIADRNGQYKELGELLLELSDVLIMDGDIDAAAEACYRCIEVTSAIDDKNMLSLAYSSLSSIEGKRGNEFEAEENRKIADNLSIEEGAAIVPLSHLK